MQKLLILTMFITFTLAVVKAQEVPAAAPVDSTKTPAEMPKISKNFVKFNITSALLKNYSIQYERVLSKGISMAVTYKMMPESSIPYIDDIISLSGDVDSETKDLLENLITKNYTITPEIRFYSGKKGYGRGFYTALFYKYGNYTIDNVKYTSTQEEGDDIILTGFGNVSSHTGGIMFGAQWGLGKYLCLDWWIIGVHFGVSSGDIKATYSEPLSEEDQQSIEDEINGFDIPMLKKTIDVTANKATLDFSGPWAGIRAGLSFGIKF